MFISQFPKIQAYMALAQNTGALASMDGIRPNWPENVAPILENANDFDAQRAVYFAIPLNLRL